MTMSFKIKLQSVFDLWQDFAVHFTFGLLLLVFILDNLLANAAAQTSFVVSGMVVIHFVLITVYVYRSMGDSRILRVFVDSLASYGPFNVSEEVKQLSFEPRPTPGDTLLNLLAQHGCQKGDIRSIAFMVYCVDNYKYGENFVENLHNINPDIQFRIIGFKENDSQSNEDMFNNFKRKDRIVFDLTERRLTRHVNVVDAMVNGETRRYILFEPCHEHETNKANETKHYIPRGAHLISVPVSFNVEQYYSDTIGTMNRVEFACSDSGHQIG